MTWLQIIVTLISIITLEGIIQFFLLKETKKGKQIENVDADVEKSQHANELLSKQLERCHETIARQDQEKAALYKEVADLRAVQSCLFDDMCVHKGCHLRKPHQGKGQLWYAQYAEDPSLGADFASVHTLIKQERLARLKIEAELGEATAEEEESNG